MTPSTFDELLDIPGRSIAQNRSTQKAIVVPVRRAVRAPPLWFIAAISLGALAATIGFSAAERASPTSAEPSIGQLSTVDPVAAVASETPLVLRGQPPLKAKRP
jgi:hypothetical protein